MKSSLVLRFIILFLVADWFSFHQGLSLDIGGMNFRLGDVFFFYFVYVYFKFLFDKKNKKRTIDYFYLCFILLNIGGIYLGTLNTKFSFALRDFQVVSFIVSFFATLFLVKTIDEIKSFAKAFLVAFALREVFLFVILGPETGYVERFLTLSDPSGTSFIQNTAILFLLYHYFTAERSVTTSLSLWAAIFLLFALVNEGKMGGILSAAAAMTIFFVYLLNRRNVKKIAVTILVTTVIGLSVAGQSLFQAATERISVVSSNATEDPTSAWRLVGWAQGMQVFEDNIWFGGGYSWPEGWLILRMDDTVDSYWGSMLHNEYLHILASGGLVGALPVAVFLIYLNVLILKKLKRIKMFNDRLFAVCFYAGFVSFLITGFTNPTWVAHISFVGWSFGAFSLRYAELSVQT
jgi:hypothetical protein